MNWGVKIPDCLAKWAEKHPCKIKLAFNSEQRSRIIEIWVKDAEMGLFILQAAFCVDGSCYEVDVEEWVKKNS